MKLESEKRETQYTPGRWGWDSSYKDSHGNMTLSLVNENGHGILSCDGLENSPIPADANLIAAAPSLLRAVEELVHEQCQLTCRDHDKECEPDCWVRKHKELIEQVKRRNK